MKERIAELLNESLDVKKKTLETQIEVIESISRAIIKSLKAGGKVIIFGNGGSAADAQHLVGEFVGRFKLERKALPAIALTTNTSTLTCVANDYSYDDIFARQIEGLAKKEDIAIGISTSGQANNVALGLVKAKEMGLKTIALTGGDGGKLAGISEINLIVPSSNTPRIQEIHITAIHIICELVEVGVSS